ncbi:MAG TPA: tetratricopeptide repeat protein [Ktedonobacterales bacterium]
MTKVSSEGGRAAYIYRSLALLKLGRLEDALASTDELLSFAPETRGVWFQRGHILTQMKRIGDAEKAMLHGIELEPENAAGLREIIDLYRLQMRDYTQAESYCERLIALHPNDGANWKLKGDILCGREDYRSAASAYERALALCANDAVSTVDVWHSYGSMLIFLGRFGEALAAFDKGVAIVSGRVRPINGRGIILSRIGRHEAALAWYEAALHIKPTVALLSNKAEALASLGRLDEADAVLDEAAALEPDAMGVWAVRGIVATRRGQHDEALAAFNRAMTLDPRHAPNYVELARLLLTLGDVEHAHEVAERARALDPCNAAAWEVTAQASRAAGRTEEASAAEKRGAALLAEQTAEVDAWLRAREARGEPATPPPD